MSLLPVAEAQARLLASVSPLPPERTLLAGAVGRYLAEPLIALRDQPWADLSAMDGYAIRLDDAPGPWRHVGGSRAGGAHPSHRLGSGEAMRIFTGAPLPGGADCILLQEDAAAEGDHVHLTGDAPERIGRHVRRRASDFATGTELLSSGVRIDAAQIALAAMAGHDRLLVHRRPRVALIATGDELAPPGASLTPGQIPASNSVMLTAMLAQAGADVVDLGLFRDDLDAVTSAFHRARAADLIVTSGGASVGDHDLVAPAFRRAGGTLDFWKIAMRPGKPLMAGRMDDAAFIGLPGNPVSAYVAAILFVLPLVRRLAGSAAALPRRGPAVTDIPIAAGGGRTEYLRAITENGRVVAILDRDSAALLPLAHANTLVERPAGASVADPGDVIDVLPLDNYAFA